MEADYDLFYKILILGDAGVGKTSILVRYVDDDFKENPSLTVGTDSKTKTIQIKGRVAKLQIFDTAGQERFESAIPSSYYRGTQGIIFVYDITDQISFRNLSKWQEIVGRYASDKVVKTLVGNKCDLAVDQEVEYDVAKKFAEEHGMSFFEVSAKDSINIDDIFTKNATEISMIPPKKTSGVGIKGQGEKKDFWGKCTLI